MHDWRAPLPWPTAFYLGGPRSTRPHNVPLVLLGAGILWFGWFGFNAGSAMSAGSVATYALVNTQLGASAAMLAWMAVEWWRRGKPSGVGIAAGAVAGLAAITPASGYVPPWAAIIIGLAAGALCYCAVHLKDILHYDDSLDVVGVHMVGGAIGVCSPASSPAVVNAAGEAGGSDPAWPPARACYRRHRLPVRDDLAHLGGHRQDGRAAGRPGQEQAGLDLAEHGETAYDALPASIDAAAGTAADGDGRAGPARRGHSAGVDTAVALSSGYCDRHRSRTASGGSTSGPELTSIRRAVVTPVVHSRREHHGCREHGRAAIPLPPEPVPEDQGREDRTGEWF